MNDKTISGYLASTDVPQTYEIEIEIDPTLPLILLFSYIAGLIIRRFLPLGARMPTIVLFTIMLAAAIVSIPLLNNNRIVAYIFLAFFSIVVGWWTSYRIEERRLTDRRRTARATIEAAEWDQATLLEHAKTTFLQYQQDWSADNRQGLKEYMTSNASYHASLILYGLELLHRQNTVSNTTIKKIDFVNAFNSRSDNRDYFTVAIHATADSRLIDVRSKATVYLDKRPFLEFWTFLRSEDNRWRVTKIMRKTNRVTVSQRKVRQFAGKNGFYYSLTVQPILAPMRGVLMNHKQFPDLDLNNHCISQWDNLLVQFYMITTNQGGERPEQRIDTLVGQINTSKHYAGILIQSKRTSSFPPSTYREYTMEWSEFNDHYKVYAEDAGRLAAFELLNPSFMAYLYDADSGISIEVSDNIICLYKEVRGVDTEEYAKFLTILQKVHKELRQ